MCGSWRTSTTPLTVRCADETSWRQAGGSRWLSVAAAVDAALFQIATRRDRDATRALLGDDPGRVIVSDRYAVYLYIDATAPSSGSSQSAKRAASKVAACTPTSPTRSPPTNTASQSPPPFGPDPRSNPLNGYRLGTSRVPNLPQVPCRARVARGGRTLRGQRPFITRLLIREPNEP